MVEISTSLLSVQKESLKVIYNLEVAHTDYYHIDVMDGRFVEANTEERMIEYTNQIKQVSGIPIDVHLMVEDIDTYLEKFIPYEPNRITFHYEACKNQEEVMRFIQKIKENGIKVGLSIKPNTNIQDMITFLPWIHMVLVMTVEPGKGSQKLIPETIEKIKQLKQIIEEQKLDVEIEADGGIKLENIKELYDAGMNIAVVGSAIINTGDYKKTIKELKEVCK